MIRSQYIEDLNKFILKKILDTQTLKHAHILIITQKDENGPLRIIVGLQLLSLKTIFAAI